MKTNKKTLATLTTSLLLGSLFITGVSAYKGDPTVQGPNYTSERHDAMEQAFETNDYEAWVALIEGRGRVSEIITADNFSSFAEAHELAENGDIAGATEIRTKLGLGLNDGSNRGMGRGNNRRNGGGTGIGNCLR